jgi:hypothetical protein
MYDDTHIALVKTFINKSQPLLFIDQTIYNRYTMKDLIVHMFCDQCYESFCSPCRYSNVYKVNDVICPICLAQVWGVIDTSPYYLVVEQIKQAQEDGLCNNCPSALKRMTYGV